MCFFQFIARKLSLLPLFCFLKKRYHMISFANLKIKFSQLFPILPLPDNRQHKLVLKVHSYFLSLFSEVLHITPKAVPKHKPIGILSSTVPIARPIHIPNASFSFEFILFTFSPQLFNTIF